VPYLPDDGVQASVDVDEDIGSPEFLDNLVAPDELTTSLHQEEQQFHGQPFQLHRAFVAAQLVAGDVQFALAKTKFF
jgi:hypothetical protein